MFPLVTTALLLSGSGFGILAQLVPLLSEHTVDSEAGHLAQLVDGIERICPERRSSSILVLFYVAGDVTAEHALVALSQRYPIMVQNSNFSGVKQPWFTKCIVGFFSTAESFKVCNRYKG
ncbi:CxxC-x17-CxxC domain-containing protein [Anopheles sinensis]|uniref:CxxC-x17-CxxC domain-containing protein n=1 Tax=Anopheles sinensis TaxID=74873 RepID=A0A084W8J8_ANOSI|nr:CxxC-x17-CxxC domain-containing protein [Anopheles sinensis]